MSVESPVLRPATDRLRETMFDILSNMMSMEGIEGLDLYAGTGSVGLEAISRGASHMTFVESDRKILSVLERNVRALGSEDHCTVRAARVERFIESYQGRRFDIAFIDPPYAINDNTHKVIDCVLMRKIVNDEGIICIEHSKAYSPPSSLLLRQRLFGSTILSLIRPDLNPVEETTCQM